VQTKVQQIGQLTTGGLSTGGVLVFDRGPGIDGEPFSGAAVEGSGRSWDDDEGWGSGEFGFRVSVMACLINRGGMKAEQVDTGQYRRSGVDHSSNFALYNDVCTP
jgi:hypothetical protein